MNDTVELTRSLARIARENDLAEIDYRHGQTRIRLVLEVEPVLAQAVMASGAVVPAPSLPVAAGPPSPPPPAAAPEPAGEAILSPLPGVFYRAPRPGAPAFVEVGQQVGPGETLCIVEAMKLMNELAAERACKILQILVNNGEAVEQGQALFRIEPLE